MRIETLSVFPEMFEPAMSSSIIGRAREAGLLQFVAHDLRNWTHDRHHTTDDTPYGGGPGQLMKVEPVFEALDALLSSDTAVEQTGHESNDSPPAVGQQKRPPVSLASPAVIFFTPVGRPFTQQMASELALRKHLIMVCGRYEGFDERVYHRADYCLSIGDYILTGGELAAMVVTDAVCRLLPGVLGDERSSVDESFSTGLLEYPQYTRPAEYRGLAVPEVLLSGNHALIAEWRRKQSIIRTARLRPDLLDQAKLQADEWEWAKRERSEAAVPLRSCVRDESAGEADPGKAQRTEGAVAYGKTEEDDERYAG
jgi:tRNA (guanine37-N1)-methyltransferase